MSRWKGQGSRKRQLCIQGVKQQTPQPICPTARLQRVETLEGSVLAANQTPATHSKRGTLDLCALGGFSATLPRRFLKPVALAESAPRSAAGLAREPLCALAHVVS